MDMQHEQRSLTTTRGGLGVLTSDLQAPEVSDTSVGSDLLQSLQVISQLRLQIVGQDVVVLTVNLVLLSVQEPGWDLVLSWVLHDGDNSLQFFLGQFTGTLVQVDISLLADQVGVSSTDTSDLGQGVHDLDSTIDVGVQQTRLLVIETKGTGGSVHCCGVHSGKLLHCNFLSETHKIIWETTTPGETSTGNAVGADLIMEHIPQNVLEGTVFLNN